MERGKPSLREQSLPARCVFASTILAIPLPLSRSHFPSLEVRKRRHVLLWIVYQPINHTGKLPSLRKLAMVTGLEVSSTHSGLRNSRPWNDAGHAESVVLGRFVVSPHQPLTQIELDMIYREIKAKDTHAPTHGADLGDDDERNQPHADRSSTTG